MNILLLEDNIAIAHSLGEYLDLKGCTVDCAYTGRSCVELVKNNAYDVLVLDIGMDGLDACFEIRSTLKITNPVIFLTARDTLDDKLAGFKMGADDYLVKPFSPDELLCRLEALNARGPRRDIGTQVIGELTINHSQKTVVKSGKKVKLSNTQFNLLALLARKTPDIVAKEAMELCVWGG